MVTNRVAMAKQVAKPPMNAKVKKPAKMPVGMKKGGKVCG